MAKRCYQPDPDERIRVCPREAALTLVHAGLRYHRRMLTTTPGKPRPRKASAALQRKSEAGAKPASERSQLGPSDWIVAATELLIDKSIEQVRVTLRVTSDMSKEDQRAALAEPLFTSPGNMLEELRAW